MKKVVMTHSVVGEANADGTSARRYLIGEELPLGKTWEKKIAADMIARGAAMEIQGNVEVSETKKKPRAKKKTD